MSRRDPIPSRKLPSRRNSFVERVLSRYRSQGISKPQRVWSEKPSGVGLEKILALMDDEIARMTKRVEGTRPGKERSRLRDELQQKQLNWLELYRKINRKPPESGLAVPVEPPKGPLPMQGGAAAPLEFD